MLNLAALWRNLTLPKKKVSWRNQVRWQLSDPLVRLSGADVWTINDATQNTVIFGANGSGKTSGSGATIAKAFLFAGFGGLVLTAKTGESETWYRYAEACGRLHDLIIVDVESGDCFNFLDYERTREGAGAGFTENIVALINSIYEIAQRGQPQSGNGDNQYWKQAQDQLARNEIELLIMADEPVSIPNLYKLIVSSATSEAMAQSPAWQEKSYLYQCLEKADKRHSNSERSKDLELVLDYFMSELPRLADKTRSIIVSSFTSTIDVLNRGLLRKLFTGDTNLVPDVVFDGKIIVVDLPVKEFFEVGRVAQVIWKTQFQRCVERRHVDETSRPVFLWVDEAHNFVTSGDMQFMTTARSCRACTVYLTQSYSNFLAALGGEQARASVDSMLGCMQTKIFHASSDSVTNSWAAESVGRVRQFFVNFSEHHEPIDLYDMIMPFARRPPSTTNGMNETMEYLLPPSTFPTLACGGPRENWEVTGVLFQGGRVFRSTGRPFLFVTFNQDC